MFFTYAQVIPVHVHSIEDRAALSEDSARGKNLKDWLIPCLWLSTVFYTAKGYVACRETTVNSGVWHPYRER